MKLVNGDDYAVGMLKTTRIRGFAALGIAIASFITIPVAAQAVTPTATDNADGVGFATQTADRDRISTHPRNGALLGTNVRDSATTYSMKPLFSEVVGYPPDMPLIFTMKLTGDAGSFFNVYRGDDTARTLTTSTCLDSCKSFESTTVTLASGLTTWNDTTELAFKGTQREINRALGNIYIIGGSKFGTGTVKFTVMQDEGVAYNAENDHFYRFVDWSTETSPNYVATGADRTWTKALADAATIPFKGVTGHLATVTTASENAFVRDRIGKAQNVFLAGSDKDREGQWKWHAGPEAGQVFYEARCAAADTCNGDVTYNDRTPAVNTYSSWAVSATKPDDPNDNEPNDWGAGVANQEDYLVANRFVETAKTQDPRWNDLPIGGSFIGGYVIEYSAALVDYRGVYTREVPLDIEPGKITLYSKRESRSKVSVATAIRGLPVGSTVELERKIGKGEFKVIATQPSVASTAVSSFVEFKPSVTDAMNVQTTEYRILIRNLSGLTNKEYRSEVATFAPIKLPVFASLVAKLNVSVGEHITKLKTSIFKGSGLKPFSKFKIVLRSEPVVLLDTTVGSDGSIYANVQLPDTTESGDHTVTITGKDANGKPIETVATLSLDKDRYVTAVNDSTTKTTLVETLPATGNSSSQMPFAALMLLMVGGGLLVVRKKSRI